MKTPRDILEKTQYNLKSVDEALAELEKYYVPSVEEIEKEIFKHTAVWDEPTRIKIAQVIHNKIKGGSDETG